MHITVKDAIRIGIRELSASNTPEIDAYVLLAKVLKLENYLNLSLKKFDEISRHDFEEYISLIERRKKFEPIALITECKEFWSLDFYVNQHTLIPRPETELIIESVLQKFNDDRYSILDLGAGSGCIGISLLAEFQKSKCIAVDLSLDAIDVAKKNALYHRVSDRIEFIQSNWLDGVAIQKFDIIVSNPPYIALEDVKDLAEDVSGFEPLNALTDFDDGFTHYRYIFNHLKNYMNEESLCFFEFGIGQAKILEELLLKNNFHLIEIKKDLSGIERIAIFAMNSL